MFCTGFTTALSLAGTCLLVFSGFSQANDYLTPTATKRVVTCGHSNHVQRLSCESGVITVQSALYGRQDKDTCSEGRPSNQLQNTACSLRGAVDNVRERCDGRNACEFNINVFHTSDPCYGTFKYLETIYSCFPAVQTVICEHSQATLQCDEGQVMLVLRADYGRSDGDTCSFGRPESETKNVQCSRLSNKVAGSSCNGKSTCVIKAINSVFGDPCVGTYKYLEVVHICQNAVLEERQ